MTKRAEELRKIIHGNMLVSRMSKKARNFYRKMPIQVTANNFNDEKNIQVSGFYTIESIDFDELEKLFEENERILK
ncbi:MAG: hypothetical protein IJY83_00985 [Oscillospiraceae bacterium]|nr:hypothetical protein [Oscillospiraceae bacterium]